MFDARKLTRPRILGRRPVGGAACGPRALRRMRAAAPRRARLLGSGRRRRRLRRLLDGLEAGAQLALGVEHTAIDDTNGFLVFSHGTLNFTSPPGSL
jgi:hypothetical protein